MKLHHFICLCAIVFTELSLQVYAQSSIEPANYNNLPPEVSPDGTAVVALFEDQAPWGSNQNENILTSRGVPFQTLPSTRMGDLDLTQFRKVVLVSQQPDDFYMRLQDFRGRFESYALGGGILEMHLANYFGGAVERVMLPFGIRASPGFCSNTVSIAGPTDPLVTTPNGITYSECQRAVPARWSSPTRRWSGLTQTPGDSMRTCCVSVWAVLAPAPSRRFGGLEQRFLETNG